MTAELVKPQGFLLSKLASQLKSRSHYNRATAKQQLPFDSSVPLQEENSAQVPAEAEGAVQGYREQESPLSLSIFHLTGFSNPSSL